MNAETGPAGYLAEFCRALQRAEVTTVEGQSVPLDEGIGRLIATLAALKAAGGKALLIGNGGSAAIVSHLHNDLCKAVGMRAMVFHETSLLTAVANDDGAGSCECADNSIADSPARSGYQNHLVFEAHRFYSGV